MVYRFIFLAITFLVSHSFAQVNQEALEIAKKDWRDTGYGFPELFAEADLQVSECKKFERTYAACLATLNSMLMRLESPKSITLNSDSKLTISALEVDLKQQSEEELEALEKAQMEVISKAFESKQFGELEPLYLETQKLMEQNIPQADQAYVAGQVFNFFLTRAYDPHTRIQPEESSGPRTERYFGVGAEVRKYENDESELNGGISINPMKGSPAESAGIKKGDIILEVDGVDITEKTLSEAVVLIKGSEGTDVTLKLKRICTGIEEPVVVSRGAIEYVADWTVDSYYVSLEKGSDPIDAICDDEKKTLKEGELQALYVPMTSFVHVSKNPGELCNEFVFDLQARDLENEDSLGMIIDLRNNGGGFMFDVACMLDTLVDGIEGTIVGPQAVERGVLLDTPVNPRFSFDYINEGAPVTPYLNERVHYNKKIIVLTNNGSASASEIFSGSIQDLKRGWVVGDKTYGKGSVQTSTSHSVPEELREPTDKVLKINRTTSIYTLNSGRSPQNSGITPDFRFDETGALINDDDEDFVFESEMFNTIQFENSVAVQNRLDEVTQISTCTNDPNSFGENLKKQLESDYRYKIPTVASYQLSLAKDVMLCSAEREPFVK